MQNKEKSITINNEEIETNSNSINEYIYMFTKTVLVSSEKASRQISGSTGPPFPLLIFLKSEEAVLEISLECMDTFILYTRQRETSQPARAINNRWLGWDYPVTGD